MNKRRMSGVLLPVFSLPSPNGIGTLGRAAYEFVDFLHAAGQSVWQVLPINPVGKGNSPYSSTSSFAGNPLFIDLDELEPTGLLKADDVVVTANDKGRSAAVGRIDYDTAFKRSDSFLRIAFSRVTPHMKKEIDAFAEKNDWLDDFALYTAIRNVTEKIHWYEWEEGLKRREPAALAKASAEYADEIEYIKFQQYLFFRQWNSVKAYANDKGISIVGDLPIYCALDSADVWASPEFFHLDEDLAPIEVSGCPPDYFSEDGQLWENPLYDWDALKKDNYAWWMKRLGAAISAFDITRIDHFRGFAGYYAIPAGEKTARRGEWKTGPGYDFFKTANKVLKKPRFIAEDLGFPTDDVAVLLRRCDYPGMKVLQFAFDAYGDSTYLPHNYVKNAVVYTGTHDNDTTMGWFDSLNRKDRKFFKEYAAMKRGESPAWALLRLAWASAADTAVTQMQDLLELPTSARVNMPGVAYGNWGWQMEDGLLTDKLAKRLSELTKLYAR
ncbi:MAG: 4-alpha-glucanotransferase [Oscillospiraceae bacterium]|jgi:4-alpha-glucanotransferase|nr:4-alpha-glucanotransferase [Oscillospiraceae bacterium]